MIHLACTVWAFWYLTGWVFFILVLAIFAGLFLSEKREKKALEKASKWVKEKARREAIQRKIDRERPRVPESALMIKIKMMMVNNFLVKHFGDIIGGSAVALLIVLILI